VLLQALLSCEQIEGLATFQLVSLVVFGFIRLNIFKSTKAPFGFYLDLSFLDDALWIIPIGVLCGSYPF